MPDRPLIGITADVIGILGTFDFGIDVFGLLSGNFRIDVPGNFSFRVAALEVEIPGVVKSAASPIVNEFSGEPFNIALARPAGSFEFTVGAIGRGSTETAGDIKMAFEDSWAMFCVHHYNQDGLIRSESELTKWISS